jgi:hypothetical protein
MKNILTLSKREITRLRARFSGKSRGIVLIVAALAVVCSYVIYHQDLAISKGLYTIGVASNSPIIEDSRFIVREVDAATGHRLLEKKEIDLFLAGSNFFGNGTERSEYAAAALIKYLEKQDLLRIASEYDIDRAFPLRIEIDYADTEPGAAATEPSAPVVDIAEIPELAVPAEAGEPETVIPETAMPPPAAEAETPAGAPEAAAEPETPAAAATSPEDELAPAAPSAPPPQPVTAAPNPSDEAVRQQLEEFSLSRQLPEFKAEFVSEDDIIIPSLMNPPIPLAQVIITFLYVVPVFFISLFFTSSFTEEKVSRKLIVLLSAPVTRLQVILGKMLPYLVYSILVIIAVTLVLGGNILLGLAIFVPVMLFIFSIYLIVALTYRTFKDQTFFSVLALSVVTVYLVGPAMFTGVNDLSYISPLTLAVDMYRGESFGVSQYFLATTPLLLVFGQTMFVGTRVFNEEYLMGFRPLHTKVAEAIYLAMDKRHLNVSMLLTGMWMVPLVFMVELACVVFVTNLPLPFMLGFVLVASVLVEEIAKSLGVVILLQNKALKSWKRVLGLAALAALGFMLAEKLLLLIAMSVVSEDAFLQALSGGGLFLLPLALHVISTAVVCLLTWRCGTRYYPLAIAAGSLIHAAYNLYVMGMLL